MSHQHSILHSPDPDIEHCDVSIGPNGANCEPHEAPRPAADPVQPQDSPVVPATQPRLQRREPKLDAVAKARLCDLVSVGRTISEAARMVGVSERAVYYGKERDPEFKQKLHESYEEPTLVCMKTLKQCAGDDRKAAMDYWKALEPERFNPR